MKLNDIDPETGHDDMYDERLKWVIEEVVEAINEHLCTDDTWIEVYETIYQRDHEYAYAEWVEEQKI